MSKSAVLETERLIMTPFSERHLTGRYLSWLNDRNLMRYSEQRRKVHTVESCRGYLLSFKGSSNFFWAIEEVLNGWGHIGTINAYVDMENRCADMGILIGEGKARKNRYGLEAWMGVCGFLFKELGMRKITAGAAAENTPMLKLMKKAGMSGDGVRKRQLLINESEVDVIHSAVFSEQWNSRRTVNFNQE